MTNDTTGTGFWRQVGRPVFAWLFACFAAGFLLSGPVLSSLSSFPDAGLPHLHEIDWFGLMSEAPDGFLFGWFWLTGVVGIITAVPSLLLVLLVRATRLPRGWTDVMIGAFLPYFGVCVLVQGIDRFNPWLEFIDLIPIGAVAGLIYWMANGAPKVADYA